MIAAVAVWTSTAPAQSPADEAPSTLTVDGRLLTGPFAFAERRGGRLFLPLTTVAEALGDTVTVDLATRSVRVRRITGVVASLDAISGQVLENSAPVLASSGMADLVFPADPRAVMLPVELVSALLDANVIIDPGAKTVRVSRDPGHRAVVAGAERGFFDVYDTRYSYNANLSTTTFTHNAQLNGSARAFDGLVTGNANLAGNMQQGLFDFRYGLLTYDRPDGQRFMLGDVSSGGDLSFLSTALRGGWYRQPIAQFDVTTFGGMARSGAAPDPLTPEVLPSLNFDTPVIGAYFTLGRTPGAGGEPRISNSTGGMWFNGPTRRAGIASTSFRYQSSLHSFSAELGGGHFEELQPDGSYRISNGLLIEATEAITPTDALTLVAGFTHVDEGFVGAQSGGLLRPMNVVSGGVNWRATTWLSTSVAGRYLERLDVPSIPVDYDVTGTASLSVPGWPTVVVNHSEGVASDVGPRALTLVNVASAFEGFELFGNFTRIRLGTQPVQVNATAGLGKQVTELLSVRGYQTVASGGGYSGGVDFSTPSFLLPSVALGLGVGYSYDDLRGIRPNARLLLAAQLPGKQRLQLNVTQTEFGAQGFLEISGPIYERPGGAAISQTPLARLSTIGSFSGQIFQDVDLDGRYSPGVDRPLPDVQVLVDGSNSVLTDKEGRYTLNNIQAGSHAVYLNLLTVRADLTLLSGARQRVELLPERDVVVNFRLVKTGRIRGLVWLDKNGNGALDEGEEPLPDVRVVAGSKDTLTSERGEFIIGDLPAGSHTVLVDEKTLGERQRPATPTVEVKVKPPAETRNVWIPIREIPREVEIKQF